MSIPGQQFSILDPGLGVTPPAINTPVFMGTSSAGTVNTVYSFSRISDVIATLGQGPLAEAVCSYLARAGGPVLAVRLTGSIAGAAGSVTKTAISTSTGTITVAGAAYDSYSVIVQIVSTGALGVATFRYSLDAGYTYSETLLVPSGGTYAVPSTNLTLTFVAGGGPIIFEALDSHAFVCTAPYYSTTNLASGITALAASSLDFAYIVLAGEASSSSGGATMAAAFATHCTTFFTNFRFVGGMMASGVDVTATTITSYASYSGPRLAITYGKCDLSSAKPFAGWGTPSRPIVDIVAARAGQSLISTDLGRGVGVLPLEGVVAITHDERITEVMDQKKFTTLRTHVGATGFYITNCNIMCGAGSDYSLWQYRRCMDVACDTTYKKQLPMLNTAVRCNADGTIDERDALRLQAPVKAALKANLIEPNNAEGVQGHVSAVDYKIDRANNVLTTRTFKTSVAIRPLGYGKTIITELGFSANVGG